MPKDVINFQCWVPQWNLWFISIKVLGGPSIAFQVSLRLSEHVNFPVRVLPSQMPKIPSWKFAFYQFLDLGDQSSSEMQLEGLLTTLFETLVLISTETHYKVYHN